MPSVLYKHISKALFKADTLKINFLPCRASLSHVLTVIHFCTTDSEEWGFPQQYTAEPMCCLATAFGILAPHRFAMCTQRRHPHFLKLKEKANLQNKRKTNFFPDS